MNRDAINYHVSILHAYFEISFPVPDINVSWNRAFRK